MPDHPSLDDAVADRIAEILDPRVFRLTREGNNWITVRAIVGRHRGSVMNFSVGSTWSMYRWVPFARDGLLQSLFMEYARRLQEFVSSTGRTRWPAEDATPHVTVTDDEVRVWYGAGDESAAALHLRPFNRHELGL